MPIRHDNPILVTGGAGFIGSNFILRWLSQSRGPVINLDALTYASNLDNLKSLHGDSRHIFVRGDIADRCMVDIVLARHQPCAIVHLAAETHVDRSIQGPDDFLRTNVEGTFTLLEAARDYWSTLPEARRREFRFLHVSTDEVYGSLSPSDPPFSELNPYRPNSPYSASKAASDHLVRAWHRTYGLPALITHCSNNYGPYQFPEKLIPLIIMRAMSRQPLPVYGDGRQVRDWLYVDDHCDALCQVLDAGVVGETYNIGGLNEMANIDLVHTICSVMDERRPDPEGPYRRLITHVTDRPGHDRRYAIDAGKIMDRLSWRPVETFTSGIRKTVDWYLAALDEDRLVHPSRIIQW